MTRTYNTLMIACNTSGQWQQALEVHGEMRGAGHALNTTSYNALISAHSKSGHLDQVLATYRAMVQEVCLWALCWVPCMSKPLHVLGSKALFDAAAGSSPPPRNGRKAALWSI